MSKEFADYTTQCAAYQNAKITAALYANLKPAEDHEFAEVLSEKSKVKIFINDFSKGKGDNSTKVDYNLEVDDIKYILDKATLGLLPKFYRAKSLDAYPEKEGPFVGLAKVSSVLIEYLQGNNYPWKIEVTVGYGKEGKIQQGRKSAKVFLNDMDFLAFWRQAWRYIEQYINLISPNLITKGLRVMEEKLQSGYTNNFTQPEIPQYSEPYVPEQNYSQPSDTQYVQESVPDVPAPQKQNAQKEIHTVKIQFISDFIMLSNAFCVKILTNGKEYALFLQHVSETLRTAQQNNTLVLANVYYWQGKLFFDSLAS